MNYILGTRGSKLALAQSKQVKKIVEDNYPDCSIELKVIKTKGDKNLALALDKFNDKGIFVKEIEKALLDGTIDFAVHSMKDMPSQMEDRLCFVKTILREDANDALVMKKGTTLDDLPQHARIGCGSIRRSMQLLKLRSDIELCAIRGNVETRLRVMEEEGYDGIILAAAGIHRLHLNDKISYLFDESEMIPACGQGALAIETTKENEKLISMLNALSNPQLDQEVQIERALLTLVDGGCHTPFGVRAHVCEDQVHLVAILGKDSELRRIDQSFLLKNWKKEISEIAKLLRNFKGETS